MIIRLCMSINAKLEKERGEVVDEFLDMIPDVNL